MSYASNASAYREIEIMSATPAQLVVMLYDHLLVNLRRTRFTLDLAGTERRVQLLGKCRDVVTELLVTLDFEKGGDIAKELSGLYTFLLTAFLDLGRKPDVAMLERVTGIVQELRDAFAQASGDPRLQAAS